VQTPRGWMGWWSGSYFHSLFSATVLGPCMCLLGERVAGPALPRGPRSWVARVGSVAREGLRGPRLCDLSRERPGGLGPGCLPPPFGLCYGTKVEVRRTAAGPDLLSRGRPVSPLRLSRPSGLRPGLPSPRSAPVGSLSAVSPPLRARPLGPSPCLSSPPSPPRRVSTVRTRCVLTSTGVWNTDCLCTDR
jgi:hypothetical protein